MMQESPHLLSGGIVLIDGVHQAVVAHAWDGELVKVVRTGGPRFVEEVEADRLTPVEPHRNQGTCTICGDVWVFHGDRTSHCRVCHETFEGGELWDAHRILSTGGKYVCANAATMSFRGRRLRKEADPVPGVETSGTWRGPKIDPTVFSGGEPE